MREIASTVCRMRLLVEKFSVISFMEFSAALQFDGVYWVLIRISQF